MNKHSCFPPAALPDAEILILGSMPGKVSLQHDQYYAHPRNLFWPLMSMFFAIGVDTPYRERINELNAHKIALWDVIGRCEREGSLDANINTNTEEVNDIAGFLASHKKITKICFNGQKAFSSFRKNVLKSHGYIGHNYELIVLPSTSPANASIPREVKISQWKTALLSADN